MKTKIMPEQIDQEHKENRMTHKDFQKLFAKDFGRLSDGNVVRGFILTTYEFQKKARPLFVLGTHMKWKQYLKAKIKKKEKEFVLVEVSYKPGKPKGTLFIDLVTGKAKPAIVAKALKRYPPMPGVKYVIGSAAPEDEEENTTEIENLLKDDRDGKKIGFGKTGFAKIKEKISELKDVHDTEEKLNALETLITKCNDWADKHAEDKNPDDVKRVEHIKEVIPKLEKMYSNLRKEIEHAGSDDDKDYLIGLYRKIIIEYKNYVKERPDVPLEEQLQDLHNIISDCNEWVEKHNAPDLTSKEKEQKDKIANIKNGIEKRIRWVNAQQELGDQFDKWRLIQKVRDKLNRIPESNLVERLIAIDDLEKRLSALKKELS